MPSRPLLIVLLVAFNLRGALIALSPLMDQIRRDTGLSSASAGLLLTLPVLCFAAFSPWAPRLARRWGIERVLAVAMMLLTIGVLVRLPSTSFAVFAGTITVGAAIALGNVLLPALVKRDFPARTGLMTGVYVTVMSVGATLAAATTIPIQQAFGLGWAATLGLWAIPAVAAIIASLPRSALPPAGPEVTPTPAAVRSLYRSPLAWQVTLFMGLQSLVFYSIVAWLPSLYIDRGFSEDRAGFLFGLMNLASLPASLAAPALAGRRPTQTHLVVGSSALTGAGLLGVILAPASAPALSMVLLGMGQGSAIGIALTLIGLRAANDVYAARLSSMAQSVGYLVAAIGPFALGAIYALTGSWAAAFTLTVAVLLFQVLSGIGAARDRRVGAAMRT